MTDFVIKQGDTSPAIEATLTDYSETPIDLTGASVRFHMRFRDSEMVVVDAAATIMDSLNGKVEYRWSAADTSIVGEYDAEWEVTYSDGTIETFPSSEFNSISVIESIA